MVSTGWPRSSELTSARGRHCRQGERVGPSERTWPPADGTDSSLFVPRARDMVLVSSASQDPSLGAEEALQSRVQPHCGCSADMLAEEQKHSECITLILS